MLLVGITGRSGSGKSSVAQYYASLGHAVVDGDQVSREVCAPGSPCVQALAEAFGSGIIAEDGSLLRRKLADIAFASFDKTQLLDDITHPFILREIMARGMRAKEAGAPLFFVEGAAIVGQAFEQDCDRLIVVTSEPRLSVSRIILRDGISKTSAHRRLEAQVPEEVLAEAASYVIENNGSVEALRQKADAVLEKLLAEAT